MKPTIIATLRDRRVFGALPAFRDLSTWRPWLTVLGAFYGLPLTPDEQEWFCRHTGRSKYDPPAGGWRELVVIVGRQSGKTRIASLIASYESAFGGDVEAGGGELYALMVAQDHRASLRAIFSYARAPFENVPALSGLVVQPKAESIELRNGVTLAAYPCRPAAVRGIRSRVVVADELGWYRSSEGLSQDQEMLRAVRPTMATTGGRLVILSSPAGQSGALWDLFENHFGRDDSPVLIVQASAPDLNPTLPADYLHRMQLDDPEGYRSEVLGEFRAGLTALLDPAMVRASTDEGRLELPPKDGVQYRAFVDASGGRRDAFAVGVGHRRGDLVIVDAVRSWKAPFSPSAVVAECTEFVRRYRIGVVVGDDYGAEYVRELFREHHIQFDSAGANASALYLDLLNPLNSGQIRLPDIHDLRVELIGLERRKGTGGAHDRVVHPPGRHDDMANVVAGVAYLLRRKRKPLAEFAEAEERAKAEQPKQQESSAMVEIITVHRAPCRLCASEHIVDGPGDVPQCPQAWSWGPAGPRYQAGPRTLENIR
jgi:hypothetical protein